MKIIKKTKMFHGHTLVEYEDGSQHVFPRGENIPEEEKPEEKADAEREIQVEGSVPQVDGVQTHSRDSSSESQISDDQREDSQSEAQQSEQEDE
jgi:hypothetical protein